MRHQIDSNNPFAWEKVVLKLLETKKYDCQRPWVFNPSVDEFLAADLFIYVDDGRPIRPTNTLFWKTSRRWGLTCSCLGIKDASKKVQPTSQSLGPWYGTVTNTEEGVHRSVSQEIWDKTQRLIV